MIDIDYCQEYSVAFLAITQEEMCVGIKWVWYSSWSPWWCIYSATCTDIYKVATIPTAKKSWKWPIPLAWWLSFRPPFYWCPFPNKGLCYNSLELIKFKSHASTFGVVESLSLDRSCMEVCTCIDGILWAKVCGTWFFHPLPVGRSETTTTTTAISNRLVCIPTRIVPVIICFEIWLALWPRWAWSSCCSSVIIGSDDIFTNYFTCRTWRLLPWSWSVL